MRAIVIRPAEDDELPIVARLRWQWMLEGGGTAATSSDDFVDFFVRWARENSSSHRCLGSASTPAGTHLSRYPQAQLGRHHRRLERLPPEPSTGAHHRNLHQPAATSQTNHWKFSNWFA
ncbi:MAG TPA: hypothetical protein VJT49_15815 [Amycolatopsis sp.]|uniref:hypothetical protein n=1 Tax=Amycolatopsis sp. TaxID=37632 RepID=UPI002B495135|nr:hypothetical protein [Amycolatopsis sp.]HKS46545.1 hypothetical protein [Amycolatopsis sp.]